MNWRARVVYLWVVLFVVGCASGEVEQQELFVELETGGSIEVRAEVNTSVMAEFEVRNVGNRTARVFIEHDADWLERLPGSVELVPEGKGTFTLEGFCDDEVETRQATLSVVTGDSAFEAIEVEYTLHCDALPRGELALEVLGLSDVDAAIELSGPETKTLTESTTVALSPGEYEVRASAVGTEVRYAPTVGRQAVTIEAGEETTARVSYELVLGGLDVRFVGLPTGVDGRAEVATADVSELLEGDAVLSNLAPGIYEVSAQEVVVHPATYVGDSATAEVRSDETATVTLNYEVVTGGVSVTVNGLPAEQKAELVLVDSEGGEVSVPASGELDGLEPGLYTVQPVDVSISGEFYAASEVDVEVVSGETAEATIEYLLDPGQLQVTVVGLPSGVNHSLELIGGAMAIAVPQSGTFNAIEPGSYTIVASDVIDGLTIYTASNESVVVESNVEASATVTYSAIPATWSVTVGGLPEGVSGTVAVTGPGFSQTLNGTTSFSDLTPGTYTIAPSDVIVGGEMYRATGASVDLSSGANGATTVTYELLPGNLGVMITGLGGLDASVVVRAPGGAVVETLTGSQILSGLVPGTYAIEPAEVVDGIRTYEASWGAVDVLSEATASVTVNYELVLATLEVSATGLPGGLSMQATITGPNGYSETIFSGQVLAGLEPGDYEVTFEGRTSGGVVYEPTPATVGPVTLSSGDAEAVTTSYEAVAGELVLSVLLPAGSGAIAVAVKDGSGQVVASGTYNDGDSVVVAGLDPGQYEVVLTAPYADVWGNEYLNVTGLGAVTIDSEESVNRTISADDPTLVVTGANDGAGSLREVLGRVNAGSVIRFDDAVSTVSLTAPIELSTAVMIQGDEESATVISGAGTHRLLTITGAEVTLLDVHLTNGVAEGVTLMERSGGAIYTDSDLGLFDVVLSNNTADYGGGAIWSTGNVVAVGLEAYQNLSLNWDGGAIYANGFDGEELNFYENSSDYWAGAILVRNGFGEVRRAVFRNNTARAGGAIYAWGSMSMTVRESLFEGNRAEHLIGVVEGGALVASLTTPLLVENTTFYQNTSTGNAGAMAVSANSEILFSTFVGNQADGAGDALLMDGVAMLTGVLMANNGAGDTIAGADLVISGGYNLIDAVGTDFVAGATDLTGTVESRLDAGLGGYGPNGAVLETQALQTSSVANGAVPAGACVGLDGLSLAVDQRGFERGVPCTIGAWQESGFVETFENSNLSGSYSSGSFVGDAVTWTYVKALETASTQQIDGEGMILRDDDASFSATLSGLDEFRMQYRKAFTSSTARQFEILVNGGVIYTSPEFGGVSGADTTVYEVVLEDLGYTGPVEVMVRNVGPSAQITYDNVRWK